jgi:hypothetical protein
MAVAVHNVHNRETVVSDLCWPFLQLYFPGLIAPEAQDLEVAHNIA